MATATRNRRRTPKLPNARQRLQRAIDRVPNQPRAQVTVNSLELPPEEDWFTPDVLHLSPLRVYANAGQKGKGQAGCEILESDYSHNYVDMTLEVGKGKVPGSNLSLGWHSHTHTGGVRGTFTPEALDQLIEALVAARDEAQKRGLFTHRPTPSTFREILGVVGSTLR